MDWIKILEIVLQLLGNCRTNRTREEVVKSVTELGPFERLALRLHFKKLGYTKEQVKEAMSVVEGFTTDPDDADEIVAAAEEQAIGAGKPLLGAQAIAPVVVLLLMFWLPSVSQAASFVDTLLPPLVVAEVETTDEVSDPVQTGPKQGQISAQKETGVQTQETGSARNLNRIRRGNRVFTTRGARPVLFPRLFGRGGCG